MTHPTTQKTTPPQKRSAQRICRLVALAFLLAVVLVIAAGAYFVRPENVRAIATHWLEYATFAQVEIRTARLSWQGEIELRDVMLRVPDVDGEGGNLFHASRVVLVPNFASIFTGQRQLETVRLTEPTFYLTEDQDIDKFTFQLLPERLRDEDVPLFPPYLPQLQLDDAVVQLGVINDGQYTMMRRTDLEGFITPSKDEPGLYVFHVSEDMGHIGGVVPTVSGTLDLNHSTLIAKVASFRIGSEQMAILPPFVQSQLEAYQPEGEIQQFDVMVAIDDQGKADVTFVLVLADASLTLPFEGTSPRMQHVSGRMIFANDMLQIEQLRGEMAGITYHVQGWVGTEAEPLMRLTLTTDTFDIPEEIPDIYMLPEELQKHYHRIQPSGIYSVQVLLERSRRGQPLRMTSTINVFDGRMSYHRFPYPVTDITGSIIVHNNVLTIKELRGKGPSGADIFIQGEVAPVGNHAAVQLQIACKNVPLDEHIRHPLSGKSLEWFDQFFNTQTYEQLLDSPIMAQFRDENPAIAEFTLGGNVNLNVRVDRPYGLDQPYSTFIKFDIAGLNAAMTAWPYPVQGKSGTVEILPDKVLLHNLQLEGLTGGHATINGELQNNNDPEMPPSVTLHVSDLFLPIDSLLLASTPNPHGDWLAESGVSGVIRGGAHIYTDEAQRFQFKAPVQLEDGRIHLGTDQIQIENMSGPLTLTNNYIQTEQLTAAWNDAPIIISGNVDWSQGQRVLALNAASEQMHFSPKLLNLIPPTQADAAHLQQWVAQYDPACTFAFAAELNGSPTENLDYRLVLVPSTLAFTHREQRIALQDMKGTIKIEPALIELEDIRGEHEHGWVRFGGGIRPKDGFRAAVSLEAHSKKMDPNTRAMLPIEALRFIDDVAFEGSYTLENGRLLYTQGTEQTKATTAFKGLVRTENAVAEMVAPIKKFNGTFDLDLKHVQDQFPELHIAIHADQFTVAERKIKQFRATVQSEHPSNLISVSNLRGSVYGGTLSGQGQFEAKENGRYGISLNMHNVELGPFAKPNEPPDIPRTEINSTTAEAFQQREVDTGLLNASLNLTGRSGDASTRRGRGDIRVTQASLFYQPLAFALIQAVHLSLPTANAFNSARVDYLVRGDTVHFDLISFASQNVEVTGVGTLDIPTQTLQLEMVARNPQAIDLGALSDMIHAFKDELIGIRVTGHLEDPQSRVVSFEGIRRSLGDVLGPLSGSKPATKPIRGKPAK